MIGFEAITHAEDGDVALEIMDEHAFDLMVTDVQMPKVNGLELLKRVRCGQSAAPRSLNAIVVTALEEEYVLATAMSLDVNGFIQKPFTAPTLIKRLLVAMSESSREAPGFPYSDVKTDFSGLTIHGDAVPDSGVHDAQKIPRERGDRFTVVSLFQLRPDMQLAEDIKTKNQTVLMPAGFTLTQTRIHRMWELEENLEKTSFKVVGGWTLD
jgi:CheY-like chemotaxis protein